jgi:DNA-3-methyladenine glycosylase
MKLQPEFYRRNSVVRIARELLGKVLITNIRGAQTGGMIVETEAYSWKERGCHAFEGKMTARNRIMFEEGGKAYVYLCYGIHHLFNVVTNRKDVAEAVLIRAIQPLEGIEIMAQRRELHTDSHHLTSGPGKLTRALRIDRTLNGRLMWGSEVWIEQNGLKVSNRLIEASKRIGIDYAGKDSRLPWRFTLRGNPWISKQR